MTQLWDADITVVIPMVHKSFICEKCLMCDDASNQIRNHAANSLKNEILVLHVTLSI